MSASIRPKHHQAQSQSSGASRNEQPGADAAVAAAAASAAGLPLVGTAEPDLSRCRKSTQGKRSIITHVACQPCQRRKHKCDGERPVCTPCLVRKRSDCVYDAARDQRRTAALKSRIQHLNKQAEDLRDIVRGIAAAPDREAAFATACELAAAGFVQAADVADAFRKEQATEGETLKPTRRKTAVPISNAPMLYGPAASSSYALPSNEALANAAPLDGPGGMSFSPWSFQPQTESLKFIQADFENTPIEVRAPVQSLSGRGRRAYKNSSQSTRKAEAQSLNVPSTSDGAICWNP